MNRKPESRGRLTAVLDDDRAERASTPVILPS